MLASGSVTGQEQVSAPGLHTGPGAATVLGVATDREELIMKRVIATYLPENIKVFRVHELVPDSDSGQSFYDESVWLVQDEQGLMFSVPGINLGYEFDSDGGYLYEGEGIDPTRDYVPSDTGR